MVASHGRYDCICPSAPCESMASAWQLSNVCADEIRDRRIGPAHLGEHRVGRNAAIHNPDALRLAVPGFDLLQSVAQRRAIGRLISERKPSGVTISAITTWTQSLRLSRL
jgi:hypothetical protein